MEGLPRLIGARDVPSTRLIRGEGGVLARGEELVALFRETRRDDSLPLLAPASAFPDNMPFVFGGDFKA